MVVAPFSTGIQTRGMDTPETRYARSGDVAVAYQVLGQGSFDVVFTPGTVSHVELYWDAAGMASLLRGVAEHARVIVFDGKPLRDPGERLAVVVAKPPPHQRQSYRNDPDPDSTGNLQHPIEIHREEPAPDHRRIFTAGDGLRV